MLGHRIVPAVLAGLVCLWVFPAVAFSADYSAERAGLLREIERHVRDTRWQTGRAVLDGRVMEVMGRVPRHEFVPPQWRSRAYENRPLPIGHGQTISQPYIVALMTDMLGTEPGDTVLEVGTGSGYQAAVLAELVGKVFTIEIVEPLHEGAAALHRNLGYENIEGRLGDGYYGWKEHAPFDAIIVTAAASHIPPPLVEQLKPGGVMLIPVGPQFQVQQLTLVNKTTGGEVTTRAFLPVTFVPLTGQH
ncbi:MAG: protein-L-isoaspartate(D-aspartate) O-methyltransferase [Xanthomonadales bacterium]|nr:protein-L-isoaspartate(D-aspartate) O-methyltransferase [Xanthomonadales bacterium]NIX13569.1 protein-L-isoaspartate(D-aspartate) O-methyltransferase [Xanthomonadales bacterium]